MRPNLGLSNPKTVYLAASIAGVTLFLFGTAAVSLTKEPAFAALPAACFALLGGAMLYARHLAQKNWIRISGKILSKQGSEPTRLTLSYSIGPNQHVGSLEEDSFLSVGDTIDAYANPEKPEDLLSTSTVDVFIGTAFLIVGTLGTGLILLGDFGALF